MRLSDPRLWIAFVSLAAVGFVAVVDVERTSPGPLTAVHQQDPDLVGKNDCSECHGGWFSSMTDSCLECHAPIGTQIETRGGLHGAVDPSKARRCALCHSEHHGPAFAIVNRQSFIQAGSSDPDAFDHGLVGFQMDGAHLELACAECHENAELDVLPKGGTRFIGLDQDCESCHEDVHEGRFVLDCTSCHGQSTWEELHSLGHERLLPLVGGHGDVGCRECHAEGEARSLEALGGSGPHLAPRECAECHESPHAASFVAGVAALAAAPTAPGAACVTCHQVEHDTFTDERLQVNAEQHAASGFQLDVPHDQVECAECHAADGGDFAARYPGRTADACSVCHADPHGGQFADGPFQGECTVCHERERFEPHAFTLAQHAQSSLELTGAHVDTGCDQCHTVPETGAPRTFDGTPSDCDACHKDAHEGFFAPFAEGLPEVEHGECARCHGTQTFADIASLLAEIPSEPAASVQGAFDHTRWTGFPVLGAHAQEACEICHPLAPEADELGRRFGRVAEHFGPFEGCQTCHADPHDGAFDVAELPAAIGEREGCERCHGETSFRALPFGFDHGAWTGFAVTGAHEEAGCSSCHAPLRTPAEGGRTWERSRGPLCADCHIDPHEGQFREDGVTDCESCHASERKRFLAFDHERDSRFPLGRAHRGLDCGVCHMPWPGADGFEVIRYRPLPTECIDCHGVHEDVLLRRKRK